MPVRPVQGWMGVRSRPRRIPLQAPLSGSTPAAPSPSGYGAGDIWAYGNWGNPIQKLTGGEWQEPTQKENNDFVRGARDAAIAEGFEIPELEESSGWLYPNTELYKWISDGKPSHTELVGREGHWKFDENGKVVPAEVPTEEQKAEWNKEWQATQPPEPAPEVRPEPSGGIMLSNALSPEAKRLFGGQGGFVPPPPVSPSPPFESTFSAMRSLQTVPQGFQPVTGDLGSGGLSLRDAALIATAIAGLGLTGGGSGIVGGALKAAPAVGRAAAAGGTGLLASLGLASPAYASGSSDVGTAAGSAVGDIRRQRALQSDRAAGRGRTRYQR